MSNAEFRPELDRLVGVETVAALGPCSQWHTQGAELIAPRLLGHRRPARACTELLLSHHHFS